jgi:hypothetical protein
LDAEGFAGRAVAWDGFGTLMPRRVAGQRMAPVFGGVRVLGCSVIEAFRASQYTAAVHIFYELPPYLLIALKETLHSEKHRNSVNICAEN